MQIFKSSPAPLSVERGENPPKSPRLEPQKSPNARHQQNAGNVSPSPRFAESAEQNGERAGVRCAFHHLQVHGKTLPKSSRIELPNHPTRAIDKTQGTFLPLRVLRSKMGRGPGRGVRSTISRLLGTKVPNPPFWHRKTLALLTLAGSIVIASAQEKNSFQFDFAGQPQPGWTEVAPTNLYSRTVGYGFEPAAAIISSNGVTSEKPFLFSIQLPEGNYRVTTQFGNPTGDSVTTVKAEQRRLMLEKVPGTATKTFIAHLHTPIISATEKVHLKVRELDTEKVNWDEKLTLEFNGTHPALQTLTIAPAQVPTVFIAGDSTVCDQPAEPWNSWGQMLPRFFKPELAVANYAESGESIKSSLGAHRFDKIFSQMKKGDWLFLQFGHNDQKDKATNALAVYRGNLKKLIARTRALGGTPVLVTSMERTSGVDTDTLGGYPNTVREVAQEENVALVDLNAMSRAFYHALGTKLTKAFQDGTHHNNYGSYELAKCVILGIQKTQLPLAKFIVDDFGAFDPAHPDSLDTFTLPTSPSTSTEKPLGN
jgi:lysophospholipase L1-like esterase